MVFAINPSATKTFAAFQVSPLSVLLDIFKMMGFYRLLLWVEVQAPLLVDQQLLAVMAQVLAVQPLPVVRALLHLLLALLKAAVPSESVAVPLVS